MYYYYHTFNVTHCVLHLNWTDPFNTSFRIQSAPDPNIEALNSSKVAILVNESHFANNSFNMGRRGQ